MPKLIRLTTAPLSLKVLLANQMRYVREHGFDVLMVSSDGKELKDVLENEQCRHEIIPMTRRMTPMADLKCLWMLYRLFKKERPDIVHSHTPKAGLLAMMAARMAGVKIRIHTIAGLRFMTSNGMGRRILVSMEKLTGVCATHVWPNSFSLLKYIETNKLVKPSKLEVIGLGSSNGINLKRYSADVLKVERLMQIKQSVRYDPQLKYFLCVGRMVKDKGIEELVRAFSHIYEKEETARLILVGGFEDEVDPVSDETKRIISTHPGIIHTGWSDEVEYYMRISFALVHPSHREGFPNVLLQAGAMYCPIICSRIEGNVDIVDNGETGLLFDVKDEAQLVDRMEKALLKADLMKEYAEALYTKITTHFDQEIVHRLLVERYIKLLGD